MEMTLDITHLLNEDLAHCELPLKIYEFADDVDYSFNITDSGLYMTISKERYEY